jgi:anaerobic selenocysteine-containing dehydrogenase
VTVGQADPLLARASRRSVLMSGKDMRRLGIAEGGQVVVRSDSGAMQAVAHEGPCRANHVQTYWPECNELLPRRYDPASGEPDYATAVSIELPLDLRPGAATGHVVVADPRPIAAQSPDRRHPH